ncbi:hypothetical protein SLS56_000719 [Neofusicoccum ribis]|uniref:Ankyrin n=1 Tax=Neofusicoccum ribis TaxID=45134 RepID=A0ABR3TBY6_9PEZI
MVNLGCVFLELATHLCGCSIDLLNLRLEPTGTKQTIYAENDQALRSWIDTIRTPQLPRTDLKILEITLQMLDIDRNERPRASEIAQIFAGLGPSFLCNLCYADRIVCDLERKNIQVRAPNQRGPELCKAARQGNLAIFQSLVKITEDVNASIDLDDFKGSALDIAMNYGHLDIVKSFLLHCLSKGVTPDTRFALQLAFASGSKSALELLIDHGADPNAGNDHEASVIYQAVVHNWVSVVKRLISEGADLTRREYLTGKTVLHGAVLGGSTEILELLLEKDININAADADGITALHEAVYRGQSPLVDALLRAKADPNACDNKGDSPIICAVRCRHAHLIKPLISAGANPRLLDAEGQSAGCVAAIVGDIAVLGALFAADSPIGHRNVDGQNPLHIAVDSIKEAVVDILLRNCPNYMTEFDKEGGMTPIHYAAYHGSIGVLRKLLGHDLARMQHRDNSGSTPLRSAIHENTLEATVKLLLEKDPDTIDVPCKEKVTPLMMACNHGLVEIAQFLLDQGTNVNAKDSKDCSVLRYAVERSNSELLIRTLLKKGATVDVPAVDGYTPLGAAAAAHRGSIAALMKWEGNADLDFCHEDVTQLMKLSKSGNLEGVRILTNIGANIDKTNGRMETALFHAIDGNSTEVAQLLLEKDCEAEAKNSDDTTPLMLAASLGNAEIVQALLKRGVSRDTQTRNKNTALCKAADKGHTEVTKLLVDGGAEINVIDKYGWTPLFRAIYRGRKATASVLVIAGADVDKAMDTAKKSKLSGRKQTLELVKELKRKHRR